MKRSLSFGLALLVPLAGCGGAEPVAEAPALVTDDVVTLGADQVDVLGISTAVAAMDTLRPTRDVHAVVVSPDTASAAVGSIVEGRVVRIAARAGDRVARDQTLVEIHSHEVSDARAALVAARSELDVALAALERGRTLLDAGSIAREDMDRRERDAAVARAEADRASEWLEHLHPTPDGSVAALAPMSGTVFEVHVRPGEAVVPGTPLVTVGAEAELWVQAEVPEGIVLRLVPGEGARVSIHAPLDLELPAHLVRQGGRIDPATRTTHLQLALDSMPEGLRAGTWATLHLPVGDPVIGQVVPRDAVVRTSAGDAVFIRESEGTFRRVVVDAQPVGADRIVVSGAPEGAEIVVTGAWLLEAALRVGGEESEG
jgi:RND family efflux transporter MFP subunit